MTQDCAHSHDHEAGLSGSLLDAGLAAAEARCGAAHERLTAPRRRVLELLLAAGKPVKAYDLMAAFAPGDASAKPPTVYRALEFLERMGFVHRIESLNAYVACHIQEGHAAAFLICDCCGATEEVAPGAAAQLSGPAGKTGFAVKAVTIEAHGLCAECQ